MRISATDVSYRVPTGKISAYSTTGGNGEVDSVVSRASNDGGAGPHSSASVSLQASLAGRALDKAAEGAGVEEKQNSKVINPADWIEPSDIALFEKVTGYTIKDGNIVNPDGTRPKESEVQGDPASFLMGLFHMRNYGTFDSSGQPTPISGEITATDLSAFMRYNAASGAYDEALLEKALEALG